MAYSNKITIFYCFIIRNLRKLKPMFRLVIIDEIAQTDREIMN